MRVRCICANVHVVSDKDGRRKLVKGDVADLSDAEAADLTDRKQVAPVKAEPAEKGKGA